MVYSLYVYNAILKVINFSQAVSNPYCGRIMINYEKRVVLVTQIFKIIVLFSSAAITRKLDS